MGGQGRCQHRHQEQHEQPSPEHAQLEGGLEVVVVRLEGRGVEPGEFGCPLGGGTARPDARAERVLQDLRAPIAPREEALFGVDEEKPACPASAGMNASANRPTGSARARLRWRRTPIRTTPTMTPSHAPRTTLDSSPSPRIGEPSRNTLLRRRSGSASAWVRPTKITNIRKNPKGNGWMNVENERRKPPAKRMVSLYG